MRGKTGEVRGKRQEARGERQEGRPTPNRSSNQLSVVQHRADSLSAPPCLNRGLNGLGDCADYPPHPLRRFILPTPQCPSHTPYRHKPIPPAPFPTRKGGAHDRLKVCLPGCSDGFERMDHAIETQTPLVQSPRKTHRHSPLPGPRRHRRSLQRSVASNGACAGGRLRRESPSQSPTKRDVDSPMERYKRRGKRRG